MTIMSGRFFPDGREITQQEYDDWTEARREERVMSRFKNKPLSLFWLGHALGLKPEFDLKGMLVKLMLEGPESFYHPPVVQRQKSGKNRIIIVPKPELMKVQKRINRLFKRMFKRDPSTFGYMGGSCYDVALRHSTWASTFKFDVKDAFFSIDRKQLRDTIVSPMYGRNPGFSGSVAFWLSHLCTYNVHNIDMNQGAWQLKESFLPQGAPSSPICFHLACRPLDEKLARVAERVGGIVSRYSDNYYFSMPTSRISDKLKRMILHDVKNKGFTAHKIRDVEQGELCRMLGYNLRDGNITNYRDFNRNFRGALYVLRTRLDRGLDWEEAYARVKGYASYAVNTPGKLLETYSYCENKIVELQESI